MGLFESKEAKRARRQVAIRMARQKVKQYVGDCRKMSGRYGELARRALTIGDESGCDQFLCQRIQYARQGDKWDAFCLRMDDLTMRGEMSGAMTGLIQGMQALNKEIRAGVSVKQMTRAVAELNLTMARLGQTEDQLTGMMETVQVDAGTPMDDGLSAEIPEDLRAEVQRQRQELMDELVVAEKVQPAGQPTAAAEDLDARIKQGLDRLRELKGSS